MPWSSRATASANGAAACSPRLVELRREAIDPLLGFAERFGRGLGRIGAAVEGVQLGLRLGGAREQLLVGLAAVAPSHVGDAVEFALDVLEPVWLGLERCEEGVQVGGGLAQAQLDVAELVAGAFELGGEPFEGRQ